MILQQLQPRRLRSRETFYAPVSKTQVFKDAGLFALEKGTSGGATTLQDITKALDEYRRLFKAGFASNAEKLTLARAFPDNSVYVEASLLVPDDETMVIGGPASVELIDREGHMITNDALKSAFKKYMDNFRTRNAMVLHSDVQVGWALPAYITRGGQIYKSGVGEGGLFFICELRGDTKIADKVAKQIEEGKLRSYSIAGSATKIQQMQKGLMPYMQVDEMELAEVTVCEKGVNQAAGFEILKAEDKNPDFPDEDEAVLIVDPVEVKPEPVSHVNISINLLEKEDGDIDFTNTFFNYMTKFRWGGHSTGGRKEGEENIVDRTESHLKRGSRVPKRSSSKAARPLASGRERFAYEEERQKRDAIPTKPRVDHRFSATKKLAEQSKNYDPYLDEPVTPKPDMTAEERQRKNIIPSIMDRAMTKDWNPFKRKKKEEDPFGRNDPDYNPAYDPEVQQKLKRQQEAKFFTEGQGAKLGAELTRRENKEPFNKMAETSPDAPKTPTKSPRKTGKSGDPLESNGHYPTKKIPTNPNIVSFLNHMEKVATTGANKPRGVGRQKRQLHPTDVE